MGLKVNKYIISVLCAACLWGMAGIFVEAAHSVSLGEMQLVFGRAFFTALLIGIIILFKGLALFKIKLKDIWIFALSGFGSIVLFNYSYYTTMRLSTYSVAAILLYTAPFFVMIFSLLFLKEALSIKKLLSLFVAFFGCMLVTGVFDSANRISGKALFFGLLTGFGYALYTIFSNALINKGYKTLTITFYTFLFAAVFSLPFIDLRATTATFTHTPKAILVIFVMALFNTVIPYLLYTTGLKGVEASVAPIIATIEPVVATFVGLFLGQKITVLGVIGIVLVLFSIILLNIKYYKVRANAKINLALSILSKRDDGYHTLDTVMQTVTLCDVLRIFPAKKTKVIYKNCVIPEEKSIVLKAANLFFEHTGIEKGAKIFVENRIPMSAGLGGGSADAAATLVALNQIFSAELSDETLRELALKLGADVPFLISGGTARAQGVGEILTDITPLTNGYFVLAKGDIKPSTKEMYEKIDNMQTEKPNIDALVCAINNNNDIEQYLENSFGMIWKDSKIKQRLEAIPDCKVFLSGSGPTFVAYFKDKDKALKAFRALKKEKINCYFAKPCENSVVIE